MTGPEHNRMFVMQVKLGDRVIGKGSGRTKQAAGTGGCLSCNPGIKEQAGTLGDSVCF